MLIVLLPLRSIPVSVDPEQESTTTLAPASVPFLLLLNIYMKLQGETNFHYMFDELSDTFDILSRDLDILGIFMGNNRFQMNPYKTE